jgi:hypothetical protein
VLKWSYAFHYSRTGAKITENLRSTEPFTLELTLTTCLEIRHFSRVCATFAVSFAANSESDFVADLSQLSITYRGSRIARDVDDATGIHARDHASFHPKRHAARGLHDVASTIAVAGSPVHQEEVSKTSQILEKASRYLTYGQPVGDQPSRLRPSVGLPLLLLS